MQIIEVDWIWSYFFRRWLYCYKFSYYFWESKYKCKAYNGEELMLVIIGIDVNADIAVLKNNI